MRPAAWASRSKRCITSLLLANAACSTLIATRRLMRTFSPSKTAPMPPSPIILTIRYLLSSSWPTSSDIAGRSSHRAGPVTIRPSPNASPVYFLASVRRGPQTADRVKHLGSLNAQQRADSGHATHRALHRRRSVGAGLFGCGRVSSVLRERKRRFTEAQLHFHMLALPLPSDVAEQSRKHRLRASVVAVPRDQREAAASATRERARRGAHEFRAPTLCVRVDALTTRDHHAAQSDAAREGAAELLGNARRKRSRRFGFVLSENAFRFCVTRGLDLQRWPFSSELHDD